MGKVGKISVIPKDYSKAFPTMEKSLREKGMSRIPGTVRMLFPYKEANGKYRNGLDENATYIRAMAEVNPEEATIEMARVRNIREKLEKDTGMDLSPVSQYYNHTSRQVTKVSPVKLADGDNIFNLDDPWQAITYHWLRVHPSIASSLQAYEKGKFPAETQYFVNDEDVESEIVYKKKKTANDAIIKFDSWSLEKRRKIARLLDLPVDDNMKEETVYNMVDNFLKSSQVNHGVHKGTDPIRIFTLYANMEDEVINIRDIVEQAFKQQIYSEKKGGRVYEGELEVFKSREELIEHLSDDSNQIELLELEQKIRLKKLARV